MQTTNKDKELAIVVCPDCNLHSVCDPAWLSIEGQTLGICCDNCGGEDEETPHLIVRFIQANNLQTERDQLLQVIRAYRDAKGRYHTQLACEQLLSLLPENA